MNNDESKYIIPSEILDVGLLLPTEILCYVLIKSFSNEKGEYILRPHEIVQKLNICEKTFNKSLKKLIDLKYISREKIIYLNEVRKTIIKIL